MFKGFGLKPERVAHELKKYLAVPLLPLRLCELHSLETNKDNLLTLIRQLAVRTARAYAAFNEPVVQNCLNKVPRLPWAKEVTFSEFQFCVQLQELAEQHLSEKSSTDAATVGTGGQKHMCGRDPSSLLSEFNVLRDESLINHQTVSEGGSRVSFHCSTYSSSVRTRIIDALQREEISLHQLPLETALALLRPERSLLHVLVNETHMDYVPLNLWFSKFCLRRVAWRVLHEHLLHLIQPAVFPAVVQKNVDLLDLVYHAADIVMEIHCSRPVTPQEDLLFINAQIDDSILRSPPCMPLLTTSNLLRVNPPAPGVVERGDTYTVDAHLKYVFREIMKNAYAAALVKSLKVELDVRVAEDESCWVVDVTDHGNGISHMYESDVWRFGFTTSAHSYSILNGFGVGLPTSKVYTDLWGGCIEAYSEEGKGTTMRIRLPKLATEVLLPDE